MVGKIYPVPFSGAQRGGAVCATPRVRTASFLFALVVFCARACLNCLADPPVIGDVVEHFPRNQRSNSVCFVTLDPPYSALQRGTATAMTSLIDTVVGLSKTEVLVWTMGTKSICDEVYKNIPKNDQLSHTCHRSDLSTKLDPHGVHIPLPLQGAHALLNWFRQHHNKVRCDVMVSHEWSGPFNFLMEVRKDYSVFITVIHGATQWDKHWQNQGDITHLADNMQNAEEKRQWIMSDLLIYPSRYMREYTRTEWGNAADKRSWVIPNILPMPTDDVGLVQPYNLTKDRALVFVGMMDRRKGFDTFIKFACEAARPTPISKAEGVTVTAHVFAAIIEEEKSNAEAACKGGGVVTWKFYGNFLKEDMWKQIRKVRGLLVYTSRHDNLPMVPLEAGHYRVPCIATEQGTGGLKEFVVNRHAVLAETEERQLVWLREAMAFGRADHLVPVISDRLLNANSVWEDFFRDIVFGKARARVATHRLRKRSAANKSKAHYTVHTEKHITMLDVRNWTTSKICHSSLSYDLYIMLHDSRVWKPRKNFMAIAERMVSGLSMPIDVIVPCYNINTTSDDVGFAFEPLWMSQWNWISCLPAVPILVSANAWCHWKKLLLHTVPPDFIIPQFGLHASITDLQVLRTNVCWFHLEGNIVQNRDCKYGSELELSHEDESSFKFHRVMDNALRVKQLCGRSAPANWVESAMSPVDCASKQPIVDRAFTAYIPSRCGSPCLLHPDLARKPDIGWVFRQKTDAESIDCWSVSAKLSTDPVCTDVYPNLPKNPFPYFPNATSGHDAFIGPSSRRYWGRRYINAIPRGQTYIQEIK